MTAEGVRLPSGTVTFLFTDIEGSTRLFRLLGDSFPPILEAHHRILRSAIEASEGVLVSTEGDGAFAAFGSAAEAVAACRLAQRELAAHPWPDGVAIRVRMGLHSGEATPTDGDYVALAVHQAARVAAAANGGQVLISTSTRTLLANDTVLRDLGRFQLRDFAEPESLWELAGAGPSHPPRALPAAAHNFPSPRTTFVGRENELAELRRILVDRRLLALVGTAGSGKSRLARELALAALDEFPAGAWLVELAPISRPAQVLPAIAHALGIRAMPGEDLEQTVGDRLRDARLLLALDNCEHVLDRSGELVDLILDAAPAVRVLATSQERLGVAGEQIWPVSPLSVPSPGSTVKEASASGAVCLFVDRAASARPGFLLSDENVAAVVDICRRLDGLPLALELSAARTFALSPGQISERLDQRFDLLAGSERTAIPRHRTLRATLEWSYDLLADVERQALRRLSVFAGAFSLDAAEAVVRGEQIPISRAAGLVERLVEHSLLEVRDDARFLALETVREFGSLLLVEAGEEREARNRHLNWVADAVAPRDGEPEDSWHGRIEAEYDELRAAITWSLGDGSPAAGLRALAATGSFLADHARTVEGRAWIDALLEGADEAPPSDRAGGLAISSRLAFISGDYDTARRAGDEGLVLAEELLDRSRVCHFLRLLGNVALYEGRIEEAREMYLEALEQGPEISLIRAQLNLGLAELMLGNLNAAEKRAAQVLERAKERHPGEVPYARSALAMVAVGRGDGLGAADLIAEALEGHKAAADLYEVAEAVEMAGAACLLGGEAEAGAWLLGASDVVYEAAGAVRPDGFFTDRYRGWTEAAQEALGEVRFDELADAGRKAAVDDAVQTAAELMEGLSSRARQAPPDHRPRTDDA